MTRILEITEEDLKKLKEEIKKIEEVLIPEAERDFERALADGDLSENSPFDIAKDKLKYLHSRLEKLKETIKQAKIIPPRKNRKARDIVDIGAHVLLRDEDGQKLSIQIVTTVSANPLENKFGPDSPLGRETLGKQTGDIVTIKTPNGVRRFEIIEIRYSES